MPDRKPETTEKAQPKWRPVRPWQHWRFAMTVTFCWVARRHFLRLRRTSEQGYRFYVCRICRQNLVDTSDRAQPLATYPNRYSEGHDHSPLALCSPTCPRRRRVPKAASIDCQIGGCRFGDPDDPRCECPTPEAIDALTVARYLRKASRSPKRHPDTRAAMLRVATVLDPSGSGVSPASTNGGA